MAETAHSGLPRHIAIIMDGNGRWAKKRRRPRTFGHLKGAEVFKTIARYCGTVGIEVLTVYAFSTENWARPKEEIDAIMGLFRRYLRDAFDFMKDNIRVRFIGERAALSEDIRQVMAELEETSGANTGLLLNVAINYGGRAEIVRAARNLAARAVLGKITPDQIDEEAIEAELYTANQPPPDLILRPSGEHRISNFLLWQCAYSEFVYMDTLWPDFTPELLEQAIAEYQRRSRRFGGV